MSKRCWLLHSWSRWKQYEEKGIKTMKPDLQIQYAEVRQYRRCHRCGKAEDELVKDGPMTAEWTKTNA